MSDIILDVQHLNKSFGSKHVLKDVSFSVERGHIVGLVGPNGAGKSTIMKPCWDYLIMPAARSRLMVTQFHPLVIKRWTRLVP